MARFGNDLQSTACAGNDTQSCGGVLLFLDFGLEWVCPSIEMLLEWATHSLCSSRKMTSIGASRAPAACKRNTKPLHVALGTTSGLFHRFTKNTTTSSKHCVSARACWILNQTSGFTYVIKTREKCSTPTIKFGRYKKLKASAYFAAWSSKKGIQKCVSLRLTRS